MKCKTKEQGKRSRKGNVVRVVRFTWHQGLDSKAEQDSDKNEERQRDL